MIELPKSQKKIARQLIELGLQRECKSFTKKIANLINSPEWETENPLELYLKLYKKVVSFDKHIGRRYDDLTGSRYFVAVLGLFRDGVLTTEDIARFDIDVQNRLLAISASFD
jgi:hypothetical protein